MPERHPHHDKPSLLPQVELLYSYTTAASSPYFYNELNRKVDAQLQRKCNDSPAVDEFYI